MESSFLGQFIITALAILLAHWTYKEDKKESINNKRKKEQERALLDSMTKLTTNRVMFQRHFNAILDKSAQGFIEQVIITDEKEIPTSVLLPYEAYCFLQRFYEEHHANNAGSPTQEAPDANHHDHSIISKEAMMARIDESIKQNTITQKHQRYKEQKRVKYPFSRKKC